MLEGIILINKHPGPTSHNITTQVKKILNAKKAGHTGSLDPLVAGMLPICINNATKVASLLLNSTKVYQASIQLGITTTTADSEGTILTRHTVTEEHIRLIQYLEQKFIGNLNHTPPMYSAIKINGKKLCNLARQGKTMIVPSKTITIFNTNVIYFDRSRKILYLRIECSKGTYIRTIAEDIGAFLGCGAFLKSLFRESVFSINNNHMISIEALEKLEPKMREQFVFPVPLFFPHAHKTVLDPKEFRDLQNGTYIATKNGISTLYDEQQCFLGIIKVTNFSIVLKYIVSSIK